jgi:hypothetical protein
LGNFTRNAPPRTFCIIQKKVKPIDLFLAITEDLQRRICEHEHLCELHKKDPENHPEPPKFTIYPQNPTNKENQLALKTLEENFYPVESGYSKIYEKQTSKLIVMVEFINFTDLSKQQWKDLNFLCLFLHNCKEFIYPFASKYQKCGGVMWALGWQKGYHKLEILGRYQNQKAIGKNPLVFAKLMTQ